MIFGRNESDSHKAVAMLPISTLNATVLSVRINSTLSILAGQIQSGNKWIYIATIFYPCHDVLQIY
jgi:hypothetical protein